MKVNMKREVEVKVEVTFYLEEDKVKELEDGYDGDAKGVCVSRLRK